MQEITDIFASKEKLAKRKADLFAKAFFDLIIEALERDKYVKIKGFGTFKLVAVSERESVNINSGERFQISGHTKVSFTPDVALKELVNSPFSQFQTVVLNDETSEEELDKINSDAQKVSGSEEPPSAPVGVEEEENASGAEEESASGVPDETPQEANLANIEEAKPEAAKTETVIPREEEAPAQETPNDNVPAEDATEVAAPEAVTASVADRVASPKNELQPEPEVAPADNPDVSAESRLKEDSGSASATSEAEEAGNEHPEEEKQPSAQDSENSSGSTPICVPNNEPRKKINWWKAAAISLGLFVLMSVSYFAGYFRVLCPCEYMQFLNLGDGGKKISPEKNKQPAKAVVPAVRKKTATPKAPPKAGNEAEKKQTTEDGRHEEAKAAVYELGKAYKISGTKAEHTMLRGENLYEIAKATYGHKDFARYIIKYNKFSDPDHIMIGTKILLPELMRLD